MRILATGSSGFIGTSFCEMYHGSRRYDIIGVDRRPARERFTGIEYVTADLTNREKVAEVVHTFEPDLVVHLAAQARVEPSYTDPIETYRANVLATIHLLEATRALGSKFDRFIYASSETVYGPASVYPTPEDASPNPQSAYAASKVASETIVRHAHGMRHVILRSAMGYGPRSNPKEQVVAKFLDKALRDEPLLFPTGLGPDQHPTRDVNYVDNYSHGVGQVIDSGVEGVYNIGSGEETSILDLAQRVVDLVGSGSIRFDPRFAYRPGETGLRTWLDISRARADFGYRPRLSLDEGLRETRAWLQKNKDYWQTPPLAAAEEAPHV